MTQLRAVVFDWAGTTVDFGCLAPTGAFIDTFAKFNVPVSEAEARRPMGMYKKDHLRVMLSEPEIGKRWAAAHGRDWTEADVEAMYREVTPRQVEAAGRFALPVPGLLECVEELRSRGLRIGGTTGYFREAADITARVAKQHGYAPDANVCADDVLAGRPAPWMLFRVMEQLGVYPPTAVVKVGDTAVDVAEARNAGAWAVAVIDSGNAVGLSVEQFADLPAADRDRLRSEAEKMFTAAGALFVIANLAALPAALDAIEGVTCST
ncbi:MAG: phosphonoacetaldehyde hydrolase [Planctomycetes bacterium]|nr:phosphonoacetaldehyde hydrolase [Planctomycetota bacterium]